MNEGATAAPLVGGPGIFPALLILAAAIQYLCVPETDQYSTVVAMATGLVLIELLTSSTYSASRGAASFVVGWAGWYGATGRESAEIGALVSVWPVLVGVLMLRLHGRGRVTRLDVVFVIACCSAAGIAVARTGALAASPGPAWTAAAAALSSSTFVTASVLIVRRLRNIAALPPGRRNDSLGAS